jgi:hypothetical protein
MNQTMRPSLAAITVALAFSLFPAIHAFANYGGGGNSAITVGTCPAATYTTIQAGVNAAAAGGTVYVCPGIYAEQVEIAKNLSLIGTSVNNEDAAIIVPPVAGLVANAPNPESPANPIAAQLWVHDANKVNIQNLTIDGTGNLVAGCTDLLAGVLYENASGVVNEIATRNQTLPDSLNCTTGLGIFVQSSYGDSNVTVENSSVHDYQQAGIVANDSGTWIGLYGNAIRGQGSDANVAQYGIQIAFGATGNVYSNAITDHIWTVALGNPSPSNLGIGILVFASEFVNITNNTIATDQIGVASESDPTDGPADGGSIAGNTFIGTVQFDGVDLCSNQHQVTGNTFTNSVESGVFLDDQCIPGGSGNHNYVSNNTINEACAGILVGPDATKNQIASNNFFNTVTEQLTGDSAECSVTPAAVTAAVAQGPHTVSPVR